MKCFLVIVTQCGVLCSFQFPLQGKIRRLTRNKQLTIASFPLRKHEHAFKSYFKFERHTIIVEIYYVMFTSICLMYGIRAVSDTYSKSHSTYQYNSLLLRCQMKNPATKSAVPCLVTLRRHCKIFFAAPGALPRMSGQIFSFNFLAQNCAFWSSLTLIHD